ncbi:type VI secretion system tip protein TssI/VgrG [Cognatiyoonia sp. IB215446]|uniref:type VI secretion system Vgr family protein n=1 Tax=Cognatiyoonia sp. IB215446 TaxID=3097355 RepID=UPI002A124C78|nr:type VI secretion system tip protein TssI/VgrG [Cognatiyoonia sp. IB215446]MDX8349820.1 type VI secretion system tip protein TssI/VgrG [Cognatiyoonia sp. IB215446]
MAENNTADVLATIGNTKDIVVAGFRFEERLSEVPSYHLTVAHDPKSLKDVVGQVCKIALDADAYMSLTPRDFAGIIMSAERSQDADGRALLDLTVQPWLGILGLSKASAIYQSMTSLDILKEVLTRNGLARAQVKGSKPKVKRDMVVQYNENDLDFVRRILAEEGFAFYFHDGSAADTMLLHDTSLPYPDKPKVVSLTDAQLGNVELEEAMSLSLNRTLRPDTAALTHYDAETAKFAKGGPKASSEAKTSEKPTVTEYRAVTVGKLASDEMTVLVNAEQAPEVLLRGTTEHPGLFIGQEIDVASDSASEFHGRFTLIEVVYAPTRGNAVSCQFVAVPKDHVAAPKRLPKPLIAGVHNAEVVGASSSAKAGDISCDAEGRVKVRFFWDGDAQASAFLRVAEPFAGKGYGAQFTPRVGHEVLVSFLHGDPDAPVITGQVYNAKNKPPFAQKDTKKSGIVTKLDGGQNELEFTDEKGKELLAMRAAKDYELIVPENVVRKIDKLETVTVGETSTLNIKKDWKVTVDKAIAEKADSRSADIAKKDEISAKEIALTATSKITLKVGSNSLELSSSGIKINGMKVEIAGKSKVDVKSNAALNLEGLTGKLAAKTTMNIEGLQLTAKGKVQAKVEGPMCELSGTGMATVKGGVVMIN